MNINEIIIDAPPTLEALNLKTQHMGFSMASDPVFGSLLCALAASKPGGRMLELGTGTGLSTAWLLHGMDDHAELLSVENDESAAKIATTFLGNDDRLKVQILDAGQLLDDMKGASFDLIFADTWIGKFERLEETLALLKPGGIYVIDDLLPQPNWPDGHAAKVAILKERMRSKEMLCLTWLSWSTGIIIGVRKR